MPSDYPPESHVLRDLPFDVEVVDVGHLRAELRAGETFSTPGGTTGSDGVATADPDVVPFGAAAIVVDVLAGALCIGVIAPDWMATSVLGLHVGQVPATGTVLLDAALVRAGRTTVTVGVTMSSADLRPGMGGLGEAMVTFSRLTRRDSNLEPTRSGEPGATFSFSDPGQRALGTLDHAIGCRVSDSVNGVTELVLSDYVRNSFGAVNGGVVAAVVDIAARACGSELLGSPVHTTDATLHYLGQARVGPVRTTASVVRSDPGTATIRVEVTDAGQMDAEGVPRLTAIGHLVVSTR